MQSIGGTVVKREANETKYRSKLVRFFETVHYPTMKALLTHALQLSDEIRAATPHRKPVIISLNC
ncbi:MAG: hypothetical protein V1644_00080 [Candidatus Micrarchaeota archaeon]